VARGQRVTITRHGVPVAMLVPPDSTRRRDLPETIRQLKEFRRGRTLKGASIRRLIEEGRRY
jgi:antitoxin (DNA-binding transcriptional repressor) of toxin-antitoxin stability system